MLLGLGFRCSAGGGFRFQDPGHSLPDVQLFQPVLEGVLPRPPGDYCQAQLRGVGKDELELRKSSGRGPHASLPREGDAVAATTVQGQNLGLAAATIQNHDRTGTVAFPIDAFAVFEFVGLARPLRMENT